MQSCACMQGMLLHIYIIHALTYKIINKLPCKNIHTTNISTKTDKVLTTFSFAQYCACVQKQKNITCTRSHIGHLLVSAALLRPEGIARSAPGTGAEIIDCVSTKENREIVGFGKRGYEEKWWGEMIRKQIGWEACSRAKRKWIWERQGTVKWIWGGWIWLQYLHPGKNQRVESRNAPLRLDRIDFGRLKGHPETICLYREKL